MQLSDSRVPNALHANIIYLAGEFSHAIHEALAGRFKRAGLPVTVEQFSVLAALFYRDGMSQKEIGTILNRDRTTMARVISNMEKNKLVFRVTHTDDTRVKLVYLTGRGKSVQKKAVAISGSVYMKVTKDIGEVHLKRGRDLLATMIRNVLDTKKTRKAIAKINRKH